MDATESAFSTPIQRGKSARGGLRSNARTQQIVVLYTEKHLTVRQIGAQLGISGASVCKRLKAVGVSSDQGEWVDTTCAHCGCALRRMRSRSRGKSYCNRECYFASRENPQFVAWRRGGHIARAVVMRYFPLEPEHVVHHHDGNQRNNEPANLAVLASASDHARHHHGRKICFLWDGRTLVDPRC